MTKFGAALKSAGMPNHAIVDTGRNGVTGLRKEWGDWCNVNGAGPKFPFLAVLGVFSWLWWWGGGDSWEKGWGKRGSNLPP